MTLLRPRRPRLAAAGAALLAATVALVVSGALTGVDQYAVSHLMPWLRPGPESSVTVSSLTLPSVHGPAGRVLLGLWTYPAAFIPSLVLVLLGARRLAPRQGLTVCALWLAGNAVELAGKLTITRPGLFKGHVHAAAFDNSLPSGHTIRSLVVAAALAAAWRTAWPYLWSAGVLVALVVTGAHTPSDVLAGVLVAVVLAGFAPPGLAPPKWGRTRVRGRGRADGRSG